MKWINNIDIQAPAAVVWGVTLDVEALPRLSPTTMTAVHRLTPGDLAVGSEVAITQPGMGRKVWTVLEVTAPRRFAWSCRLGWYTLTATHEVTPVGTAARNTLTLELAGFGARVFGALIRQRLNQVLQVENEGFKRLSEAAAVCSLSAP